MADEPSRIVPLTDPAAISVSADTFIYGDGSRIPFVRLEVPEADDMTALSPDAARDLAAKLLAAARAAENPPSQDEGPALKIGDRVTHPRWNGDVATIVEIMPGLEPMAVFAEGGIWRVSQLQRAPSQDKETTRG